MVAAGERPARSRPIKIGRYELYHKLGTGGMASVYIARLVGAERFERWVAVKRIHEHLAEDDVFREMFLNEARLAAKLNHPNIVQVTDIGTDGDHPFLVMEYVNGETLSQLLRSSHRMGKPLPKPMAARIVAWACEGLHHAHELQQSGQPLGLVHRDISPQNVMVSYDGGVKLTDFGIAKAVGLSTHTRTGHLKGKIAYMSPEQALAQPLDRRSDVFAMGIVLYEATLSRRLFRSDSELETLQKITTGEIPPPSIVDRTYPKRLGEIVMKALSVKPADRYQTIREMQADLERYLASLGEPVGSAEIAETMKAVFKDRLATRENLLASTSFEDDQTVTSPTFTQEETSGFSLLHDSTSLPGVWADTSRAKIVTPVVIGVLLLLGLFTAAGIMISSLLSNPEPTVNDASTGDLSDARVVVDSMPNPETPSDQQEETEDAGPTKAVDAPPSTKVKDVPPVAPQVPRRQKEPSIKQPTVEETPQPPAQPQETGYISVIANPWCEVYLGSRRLGRTPIKRVTLPAGTHTLRLLPLGEEPARQKNVTVRPNELTPVVLQH